MIKDRIHFAQGNFDLFVNMPEFFHKPVEPPDFVIYR